MTLIELFMLLWSLVGGQYEWHNGLPPSLANHPAAYGAFSCETGQGWVKPNAPLSIVVHELAHAYDCSDDGELNGSPGHPPQIDWGPVLEMVGADPTYWRAEHYAYAVVSTGRLH